MNERRHVNVAVSAQVGPVDLRLFPYREDFIPPDDCDVRPWAWGALCRVTFWFGGDLRVTKRLTQRFSYWEPSAFGPDDMRPSDASLAGGREAVLNNLVNMIRRHGIDIDVADLNIREEAT